MTAINVSLATQVNVPQDQVSVSIGSTYVTAVYNLTTIDGSCAVCDSSTESGFRAVFCSQLPVPSCGLVTTECVKGQGLPGQMIRIPFLPAKAVDTRDSKPCSDTQMATQVEIDPTTDNVEFIVSLFSRSVVFGGFLVSSPNSTQVGQSASLDVNITNPRPDGDTSTSSTIGAIAVTDIQLKTGLGAPLGVPWWKVYELSSPIVVTTPVPAPAPPVCDSPKLGKLCGADAAGAIAGIAIGGALLLALIIAAAIYGFKQKETRVVVIDDDFNWQSKYTHIMPTNMLASPYITQYAMRPPNAPGGAIPSGLA